jgi:hypothetical protein
VTKRIVPHTGLASCFRSVKILGKKRGPAS